MSNSKLLTTLLWALPFTLLFSAKIMLIALYGSSIPFWDQWDAEAANLYKPWLEGNVSWSTFFGAHNEHRIFTTRILHIFLFEVNGRVWAPIIQMILNAIIHVAALGILVGFLSAAVGKSLAWRVACFASVIYMIPFGWENSLSGFQTQFYLLLLLSFILLWISSSFYSSFLVVLWANFLSILLVFTMASGSLSVFVAVVILCFRRLCLKQRIPWLFIFTLLFISISGIFATPSIEGHSILKSSSFSQLIVAMGALCAWPLRPTSVSPLTAVLPILMQMPLLFALVICFRQRAMNSRPLVFFFAMSIWFGLQVLALAYGRAAACYASRYLDVLCVGLVINFAAILFLLQKSDGLFKHVCFIVSALWFLGFGVGLYQGVPVLRMQILPKAEFSKMQEINVQHYLTTGNSNYIFASGHMGIPYPDPSRLMKLLNDPLIRSFLPSQLKRSSETQ